MKRANRVFPYSKAIMLNVVYDTIDRLGMSVASNNSERGQICLRTPECGEVLMQIDTVYPQEGVRVTITSQKDDTDCNIIDALFDEIDSTITASMARL